MNLYSEISDVLFSPYFWLSCLGLFLLTLALFFKNRLPQGQLSIQAKSFLLGLFLAIVASIPTIQWLLSPAPEPVATSGPDGGPPVTPQLEQARAVEPLKPGQVLPEIPAGGWVNSPESGPDTTGKVIVLDVWALWCPFCKSTAPGLVLLAKKYADKGVQFVSITNLGEQSSRPFLEQNQFTWPSAYGVDLNFLGLLDSVNDSSAIPGYEVKPTIIILDRSGKIVWSDNHARFRHQTPEKTTQELDEAIGKALKSS